MNELQEQIRLAEKSIKTRPDWVSRAAHFEGSNTKSMTNHNASKLSAMRKKVSHKCPVCGDAFEGIKKAVYCSNRCRQKAKYQRSKT